MIWQRSPWRGRVAAVLAATAFQAASAPVVRGQSGAAEDRAALEALYDATGGENWTDSANWKTDAPLRAWHGVTTDDAGRVSSLELSDNGLAGPIPDALGSLANLEYLSLSSNELSGPIPDALGSLANLQSLNLEGNALSGPIPDWLGSLANLQSLYLADNELNGPIPDALGRLANLRSLSLGSNELSGPIPDWLGRLANLRSLNLEFNELSGPIPDALGSLTNLEWLSLGVNALSGPIPDALGSLANLEYLRLGSNELTGPIPDWLGSLANLRSLNLGSNELSGPIPDALGGLSNLEELRLHGNALSGPIPDALGRLSNLQVLRLSSNELTGPIPDWLGSLANLQSLNLAFNALSGQIPDALGRLTNLEYLALGINDLSGGPIPDWLGSLANLQSLRLDGIALSGPIPDALGRLAHLESLNLYRNELSGPIPDALGRLANLQYLRLSGNLLTGPIPDEFGSLANLEYLNLEDNDLSGPVPDSLGRLANLQELYLGWNWLTGTLPTELTQLSALKVLDIEFTGVCAPVAAFREWLAALDFFFGDTCPLPPQPVGTMPAQTLGPARGVSAEPYFSDPNDDPLTWSAASSNPRTVGAFVSGDTVWLVPGAAGSAVVTVTARDPGGLSAAQDMAVTTVEADGPQSDREVLGVLYDFTGGANWTDSANWKTAAPLGAWRGVTTDAAGRVTGLELDYNELSGPIPDALGRLANLEQLSLNGNELTGPIPDELGSLSNLRSLRLGSNALSGPIPVALGRLSNLQSLSLYYNALSGPIPDALGSLADLLYLDLFGNELSGPIPAALGRLANLRGLRLDGNALSGPIPDELGSLANLQYLELNDNDLSGPIPAAFGRLANLERLDLSRAWGLSGPLPPLRSAASLAGLDIFFTQACAPAAWSNWLKTIDFRGRLCGAEAATVDVAVVYTPAAREASGGAAEIEALIDLMVAEANQAYAASGMRHRVALTGRTEVQYVETGSSSLDLYRLSEPSDGHMDEAHALRDRAGADLVHLIVDADETDVTGRAYLDGAFGLTGHDTGVVGIFAHELGHNFGAEHDRHQVHHYERGTRPHPAYGYVNPPGLRFRSPRSSRWKTIMSYRTQCYEDGYTVCWGLNRFSNPRQQYGGDRLGVPFSAGGSGATGPADVAAVLDATMPAAALWREPPPRPNRPPTASGALPDRTLPLPGVLNVDFSRAFVDPNGDPLAWSVSSSAPGVVAVAAAGPRVTLTAVGLGTAQIRVTATDPGGLSASQSFAATVADRPPASFIDDPIRPGETPIRAVHFTELRSRIDGLRQAAGLAPFAWTDPVLWAGATPVRFVHLLELRQALGAAYQAAGRPPPPWTDAAPAAGSTPIRAVHITELRAAVVALE